jgi:hypothetical protein
MTGRAETRTPEPPDRDEHENSPPRLLRPRRSTRPPHNYAQEQEFDIEQGNARSQQKKKTQSKPVAQREAVAPESSTESEDPNASELLKELVKLRKEIRQRDELHKEELQKAKEEFSALKEEFSAALAEVRHELQTLADRPATPQPHLEPCSQNNHDEILREIQSLREEISVPRSHQLPFLCRCRAHSSDQSPKQHTDPFNAEHNTIHLHRHVVLHGRHLEDDRKRKREEICRLNQGHNRERNPNDG